ncbi:hypothetical protein [Tepidibacter hydrothermalis]|uniref:DUF1540 domain-containing protein n=1 Tax=Tepidibacter hydrothermalis TaxID=3036126 RepID=A0ABY8EGB4_9FIRM|nr:hypothetical protein [Tepidibacter hydrothermalis]WFD11990.1 hypothetical protein P4S50_07905 [Tepidibacter hydrothermalis]
MNICLSSTVEVYCEKHSCCIDCNEEKCTKRCCDFKESKECSYRLKEERN